MIYSLIVTEHADELLDNLVYHLLFRLKNQQAAKHLMDGIEDIYDRLKENPQQFPLSRDAYLSGKTLNRVKSDSHQTAALIFSRFIYHFREVLAVPVAPHAVKRPMDARIIIIFAVENFFKLALLFSSIYECMLLSEHIILD